MIFGSRNRQKPGRLFFMVLNSNSSPEERPRELKMVALEPPDYDDSET
jgi:hypothetical protein